MRIKRFKSIFICLLVTCSLILTSCGSKKKTEADFIRMWDKLENEYGMRIDSDCGEAVFSCDVSAYVSLYASLDDNSYELSFMFDQRATEPTVGVIAFYFNYESMGIVEGEIIDEDMIHDDYLEFLDKIGYSEDEMIEFAKWIATNHQEI